MDNYAFSGEEDEQTTGARKLSTAAREVNPRATSNPLSILLLWWMNNLLNLGYKKTLQSEDLLPLLEHDKTERIVETLVTEWKEQTESARAAGKQPKLWKAILRVIPLKGYMTLVAFRFLTAGSNIGLVLLIWLFLRSIGESSSADVLTSSLYIVGIGTVSLARALFVQHSELFSVLWGMRLKAAIVGTAYRKILVVTRHGMGTAVSVNTINLVSNDARKMQKAVLALGTLISSPIELISSICIFWLLIGWKALVGLVFFVLVTLYIFLIARKMSDLQRKAAGHTDRRLALLNEVISGIRAIKMNVWEWKFRDKINELRRKEVGCIRRKGAILASFSSLTYTATSIAALFSVAVLLATGIHLQAFQIFTLLVGFNVMKFAICIGITDSLTFLVDVHIALKRVQAFLEQDIDYPANKDSHEQNETSENPETATPKKYRPGRLRTVNPHTNTRLTLTKASSTWTEDINQKTLHDISVDVADNQLVVVTGPVGCGKSSLLQSVIEELPLCNGNITTVGRVAYVSQAPWIFSGTVRENIVFGRKFKQQFYLKVLEACDLPKDFATFPAGDETMVGQHGASLSGGQQARVSLARAVYSEANIYLLDDPLSAVDSKVGKRLFDQCICGMLSGCLRVLATHQVQFLKAADHVIILDQGKVTYQGSPQRIEDVNLMAKVSVGDKREGRKSICEMGSKKNSRNMSISEVNLEIRSNNGTGLQKAKEDRNTGSVTLQHYWVYLKAGLHPFWLIFMMLSFCFSQVCLIAPNWWLSRISTMSRDQQREPKTLQIYAALVALSFIIVTLVAFWFYYISIGAAKTLHQRMTGAVLKSPAIFFDTNPAGRILNRFSRDIGLMDDQLPTRFVRTIQLFLATLSAILVPAASNYWLLLAVLPFFAVFVYYGRFYLKSARELKRLEALKCSPVYSNITETIAGLETIRTCNAEGIFLKTLYRPCLHDTSLGARPRSSHRPRFQDENTKASFMAVSSARWMGVRLELLSSVFVTVVAIGSLVIGGNPATAGLSLTFAVETLGNVQYLVRTTSQVESIMTSVERVLSYTKLEAEPGYSIQAPTPELWPQEGRLQLENVRLEYTKGGVQVLSDVTLNIAPKEKVGVVGRTGAGKSSIVAALFRMPDPKGKMLIDGVDIGTLNLQVARKAMGVITQDPVLYYGSLRENLDPTVHCTDACLWSALEKVGLKSLVQELPGQLQYHVTEFGSNFSVGEQQLLCLARALTRNTEILIMDEPTANVDFQTDQMIQTVVQQYFKHCTVLTIAHRLDTVMNYDKVLVLDGGRVAEFDNPKSLLQQPKSLFYQMVKTYKETMSA